MAGGGAIAGGIVMLILGIIITGIGFAITNQCNSFGGQLGSFFDNRNQAMCGISGFGLIVGIFFGIIGLILIVVGAVQQGASRKKTISQQSTTPSNTRTNYEITPNSTPQTIEKIYCRYCGKERRTIGDFCPLCGRSSQATSYTMKQCHVCDTTTSEDSKFCANCGAGFGQTVNYEEEDAKKSNVLQTVEDPRFGIKMQYPLEWNKEATNQGFVVYPKMAAKFDKLTTGLWVGVDYTGKQKAIEDYLQERVNKIERNQEGFKLLESKNDATLSGIRAYKLLYIAHSNDKTAMVKRIEFGAMVNGMIYQVNGGSETRSYSKYLPTIERMISSIELKN